jgi:hypothetical protein
MLSVNFTKYKLVLGGYLKIHRVLLGFYPRYIYIYIYIYQGVEFLKNQPHLVHGHFRKLIPTLTL